MKQSTLITKTFKDTPADAQDKATALLTRAGYISKLASGISTYLPLGTMVLDNTIKIITEEMDSLGGQKILMPALQPRSLWEKTGRWDSMGEEMFKLSDRRKNEWSLGMTHEEVVTDLVRQHITSYVDLPKALYQIQTKFRDEPRAKAGLMRQKEFVMKDMYSFHRDEEDLALFYQKVAQAYQNIFKKVGLENVYQVKASGGEFTKLETHEFQFVSDYGEDTICLDDSGNAKACADAQELDQLVKNGFKVVKTVELGHIFSLGTKYSEALGVNFTDEKGKTRPIVMGCYGIGIGRLISTVAFTLADAKGLVWPGSIAPFKFHLIDLTSDKKGEEIYRQLRQKNISVLYDDREASAGEKFAEADLIGIPNRLVVSEKTGDKIESKERSKDDTKMVSLEEIH